MTTDRSIRIGRAFRHAISLVLLLAVVSFGCDSGGNNDNGDNNGNTSFRVKYEVTGSCDHILAVGYTINGGADGATPTLPWSHEETIAAPTPFTAVALSVSCSGNGANNSITAKIFVDGNQRDAKSASGTGTISVSASTLLN
jgi:hypothetical protein